VVDKRQPVKCSWFAKVFEYYALIPLLIFDLSDKGYVTIKERNKKYASRLEFLTMVLLKNKVF